MWLPDETRLVKVKLHDQGEDVETAWAEDLGPLPGSEQERRVRLGNVPFLHAKPTYGDVIVVARDSDGVLEWDARGIAYENIGTRIEHDDGRWAVIIDYAPRPPHEDADATFRALDIAGEKIDIVVEGAFVHADRKTARAYLAVPRSMTLEEVLDWLRLTAVWLDFTLVHPVDDT